MYTHMYVCVYLTKEDQFLGVHSTEAHRRLEEEGWLGAGRAEEETSAYQGNVLSRESLCTIQTLEERCNKLSCVLVLALSMC